MENRPTPFWRYAFLGAALVIGYAYFIADQAPQFTGKVTTEYVTPIVKDQSRAAEYTPPPPKPITMREFNLRFGPVE